MLRIAEAWGGEQAYLPRVALVERHPIMRLGFREFLGANGVRVVCESGDGDEAVRQVRESRPDLVILDLDLEGGTDGVEVCRRMKRLPEAPYVLVYTAYSRDDDVSSCLFAGADSYLHKYACGEKLLDGVRRTLAGERVWLIDKRVGERSRIRTLLQEARLTSREQEVLSLVLRRCSNPEISERLYIGLQTAKNHVSSILRKLGVNSREELRRLFKETG